MSCRTVLSLTLFSAVSIFVLASVVVPAVVAARAEAQVHQIQPLPEPKVVSGADFGFRIEGDENGTAVGTLVVRVNGKWIAAREGAVTGLPRITTR
jgi:hypothetical protein